MSRSPVPKREQAAEGNRLDGLKLVKPTPSVWIANSKEIRKLSVGAKKKMIERLEKKVPQSLWIASGSLVKIGKPLHRELDAFEATIVHVGQKDTRIPAQPRVLLVSSFGIVLVEKVAADSRKRARMGSEEKTSKRTITVVSSWTPSVLKIGTTVVYPGRKSVSGVLDKHPDSAAWRPLQVAHTPFYAYAELGNVVMDHHSAGTTLYCCKIPSGWYAVFRLSSDGYECTKCSRAFPTIGAVRAHSSLLRIRVHHASELLLAFRKMGGSLRTRDCRADQVSMVEDCNV